MKNTAPGSLIKAHYWCVSKATFPNFVTVIKPRITFTCIERNRAICGVQVCCVRLHKRHTAAPESLTLLCLAVGCLEYTASAPATLEFFRNSGGRFSPHFPLSRILFTRALARNKRFSSQHPFRVVSSARAPRSPNITRFISL